MKKMAFVIIFTLLLVPFMISGSFAASARDASWLSNTANMSPNIKKAKTSSGVPIGTVIAWPYATLPAGGDWLECNGQAVNATAYPEFVAKYGATVPDFRGMFLRGYGSQSHAKNNGSEVGTTSTTHASGSLGVIQGDSIRNMTGMFLPGNSVAFAGALWGIGTFYPGSESTAIGAGLANYDKNIYRLNESYCGARLAPSHVFNYSTARVTPVANEIRPVNKAVKYIVKARWYPEFRSKFGANALDYRGRFLEGSSAPGVAKNAGLPNISGEIFVPDVNGTKHFASGSFTARQHENGCCAGGGWSGDSSLFVLDASRSSSIYGKSSTVQPSSYTVKYIIKARWYPEFRSKFGANVPDYRGYFLRGVGGNSAALGASQGDAIRNITGSMPVWSTNYAPYTIKKPAGAIARSLEMNVSLAPDGWNDESEAVYILDFNASRVVPTASENRPINKSVKYIIKTR